MGNIYDRFEEKMDVDPATGCWIWNANKYRDGYGQIKFCGKPVRAHRLAWELYFGPVPRNMQVLHQCDVPLCVNPAHLFLGTHQDNMRDKVKKGRQAKGEQNGGGNKLTTNDVRKIKRDLSEGVSQRGIAKKFNVSQAMVSLINTGIKWSHVA
jgi:hypothetical protein